MTTEPRWARGAEHAGRTLAGALAWLLAFAGALCVGYTFLRAVGPAPWSALGFALALAVSLLTVAAGLYGHPRLRERVRAVRD
ncbi:hypothetical protein [Salarchaeum japonicum]|uniref:Uncharacterized protein n=1 Tax=Salarchaeum japonicum TaxID=555573 RepID=A0AAV3SZ06_9EURY|nr:hypothetical protein [Salarchaeum japonicum]